MFVSATVVVVTFALQSGDMDGPYLQVLAVGSFFCELTPTANTNGDTLIHAYLQEIICVLILRTTIQAEQPVEPPPSISQ